MMCIDRRPKRLGPWARSRREQPAPDKCWWKETTDDVGHNGAGRHLAPYGEGAGKCGIGCVEVVKRPTVVGWWGGAIREVKDQCVPSSTQYKPTNKPTN